MDPSARVVGHAVANAARLTSALAAMPAAASQDQRLRVTSTAPAVTSEPTAFAVS